MYQLHFSKVWNIIKHGWLATGYLERYIKPNAPTPHHIQNFALNYEVFFKLAKISHISLSSLGTTEVFWQ